MAACADREVNIGELALRCMRAGCRYLAARARLTRLELCSLEPGYWTGWSIYCRVNGFLFYPPPCTVDALLCPTARPPARRFTHQRGSALLGTSAATTSIDSDPGGTSAPVGGKG